VGKEGGGIFGGMEKEGGRAMIFDDSREEGKTLH